MGLCQLSFGQGPCNEENLSNNFENGLPSNSNGMFPNQITANDITIPADTDMSLTSVNANLWIEYQSAGQTGGSIVDADITIYNDVGGLPGTVVETYTGVIPSSQTLLGTQFGFVEVFDVAFDIPATDLLGQLGTETTYWVSIFFTIDGATATNGDWEVTMANFVGNPVAFSLDQGTNWQMSIDFDGVYSFEGDCTPTVLGIDENNPLDGFTFYPNPSKNTVYLQAMGNIETAQLYNILGQKLIDTKPSVNAIQLNISELKAGMYILKATVDGKIGSFTLIKE